MLAIGYKPYNANSSRYQHLVAVLEILAPDASFLGAFFTVDSGNGDLSIKSFSHHDDLLTSNLFNLDNLMATDLLHNINIQSHTVLLPPEELKNHIPVDPITRNTVLNSRQIIRNILEHQDHRFFVVVGPCSIHDTRAAMEYAQKLCLLARELSDTLFIAMRVYFEKPRTTVGWKGLINDPYLDDSFEIEEGLHIGRQLLNDLGTLGLPTATEALDPISPQYLQDLISWSAIGARTTESQTHREMSSGLSTPIGFKNGTDGNLQVAINALESVAKPHRFLGINQQGQVSIIHTKGNRFGHIVLRGGDNKPNYDSVNVTACEKALAARQLAQNIMIDCSHANSNKDPSLQPLVLKNITQQILEGNQSIFGVMIESNLEAGSQKPGKLKDLRYGVSITDACIDWSTTEKSLREMASELRSILPQRHAKVL